MGDVRIELGVGKIVMYLIELRAVKSLFRKIVRYPIELRVVRRMLGEM